MPALQATVEFDCRAGRRWAGCTEGSREEEAGSHGAPGRTGVRRGACRSGAPGRGSRAGRGRGVCACAPFPRRGTDSKSNTPRHLRRGRQPEGAARAPPAAPRSELSSRSLPASPEPAGGPRRHPQSSGPQTLEGLGLGSSPYANTLQENTNAGMGGGCRT